MRVVLLNPHWRFDHSIYFGCREPHLPLELACAKTRLEQNGHSVLMLDGHLTGCDLVDLAAETRAFQPDMVVVTTAPSYLFWRCAQPEVTIPRAQLQLLDGPAMTVAIGPHGSSTPRAALRKLGVDVVLQGEPDETIALLANAGRPDNIPGAAWRDGGSVCVNGGAVAASFTDMPALSWPDGWIARHRHHHHRFDVVPDTPGAEVEASRGCPYACTFCAKIDFRDRYRRRELTALLTEIDRLISQGVGYVYFIDEIFLPQRPLLEALRSRPVQFGVQTRIDLWKPELLDLLGAAGCVSVEAGVESLTPDGRDALDKKCRLSTDELTTLLLRARRTIPFVQANLIKTAGEDAGIIADWRAGLQQAGVWSNDPVPLFPYPSSPEYRRMWGEPDDDAWERAHAYYLTQFDHFSEIQEARPLPLRELEGAGCGR